jgi:hypothetical protein
LRNAFVEEVNMRKQLLLSTGIVCLMLAPAVSFAQSSGGRGEEQKQMRPSEAGKGAASQERGAERMQERAQGAEQKAQGAAGREERGAGSRQTEERTKAAPSSERPSTASDDKRGRGDDAKSSERAQDSRQGGRDAQTARERNEAKDSNKDSTKGRAETDRDNAARGKSSAEQEKSKDGTAAQREREGTAATQKEQGSDQREGAKNAAEQGKDANRPSTATDTTRTQPSNNAQNAPAGSTGQTTQSQTGQTQVRQQSSISTEKQVRISQTLTRERLAPPERNLNIAIRIGEPVPRSVRFHRLPPEIVSIEPEYRDYEYFSTDDDIVIVEPGTKRIVSQIPRDASRIRAAGDQTGSGGTSSAGGYTSSVAAAGGASPCRIMRRDTAGNVTELTPQTVGSTAQQEAISVTVRVPGGATTAPISMGAPDGQIVVSGQSGADCMVTIEPPTR